MNYIAEINAFYTWLQGNSISGNAQALWHRLMAYCNAFAWRPEFTVTNIRLTDDLGVSRQELDRVRNVLCQKGLITYKKGNGNKCGTYRINSFVSHNVTQDITQDITQHVTQDVTQDITQTGHTTLPLDKLNETKQKTLCDRFEKLWVLYPNKKNKKKAKEKFNKVEYKSQRSNKIVTPLDDEFYNFMLRAIEKQKQSEQWKRGVIPHLVTWLNQERWNDIIGDKPNPDNQNAYSGYKNLGEVTYD